MTKMDYSKKQLSCFVCEPFAVAGSFLRGDIFSDEMGNCLSGRERVKLDRVSGLQLAINNKRVSTLSLYEV